MSLKDDLQTAVDSAEANAAKLAAYVHGPAAGGTSLVAVDSGNLKTLARQQAEHDAAVANGIIGPAPWATPVAFANGIVCTPATATDPATAFTYLGETYVCVIAHTTSGSAPDLAKVIKITTKGVDGTNGTSGLVWPGGRLTLSAGLAVMTGDVAGATTLRYTPHIHARMPIYDGASMASTAFAELTNDLTQSATGKAGPAAAGPYQAIDGFVWNDSGTPRLTRGPKFRKAGTFTISVATPAVVTWAGHGLHTGATWTPESTTGNLPTGAQVVVGTTYFVTKVDADTFKLSTTLVNQIAGTFIATSGTQSGVHTGANYTVDRGTGAGTSELERVDGIWVNKHDIINGPAAQRGTWVGTIYCNSSSEVDFKLGSIDADFGEAIVGIWNAYNRVSVGGCVRSSLNSWTYSTATWRPANASAKARATMIHGLAGEYFEATGKMLVNHSTPGAAGATGVALNTTITYSSAPYFYQSPGYTNEAISFTRAIAPLGLNYITMVETTDSPSMTFFGDNNDVTKFQSGLFWKGEY